MGKHGKCNCWGMRAADLQEWVNGKDGIDGKGSEKRFRVFYVLAVICIEEGVWSVC